MGVTIREKLGPTITIRVSQDMHDDLKTLADAAGITVSDLIRVFVDSLVNKKSCKGMFSN